MDSFELNKILGAVLGTCLVLLALNITAEAIFSTPKPEKPGFAVAVEDHPAAKPGAPAVQEQPFETLLASANVEKGKADTKVCAACHTFAKGEPNRVGPNLWGIVGRARAAVAGFNYSAAMKAKGGTWTIDELNKFLANPKGAVPGTNMAFAGVQRGNQRADIVAYLNSLADSPQPLPKAAEAPAAAPKAQ